MNGRSQFGLSLVELLVVIAIVAILLGVAVVGSRGLIARTAVQEGAHAVARTVDRARTESKRTGVALRVVLDGASRQVRLVDNANAAVVVWSQTLPQGTVFDAAELVGWEFATTPLRFVPPHAALADPISGVSVVTVAWANDTTIARTANVSGVFGKVVVQ